MLARGGTTKVKRSTPAWKTVAARELSEDKYDKWLKRLKQLKAAMYAFNILYGDQVGVVEADTITPEWSMQQLETAVQQFQGILERVKRVDIENLSHGVKCLLQLLPRE